jgi:hypothetical protein
MNRKSTFKNMPKGPPDHPYKKYENTELWDNIKQSIKDLEGNQDLSLTTLNEYVVGYICQQLDKAQLVKTKSLK